MKNNNQKTDKKHQKAMALYANRQVNFLGLNNKRD